MADEERVHLGGDAVYDKDLLGGSANKGQGMTHYDSFIMTHTDD